MRVILADDHILFRESFSLVLQTILPTASIIEAGSWDELKIYIKRVKVDLLLLDLFMPGKGGWEKNLLNLLEHNNFPTCIISGSTNRNHIETAFDIGVNGYICKTEVIQEIEKAIKQVCGGNTYLPPLIRRASALQKASKNLSDLTTPPQNLLLSD